MAHAPLSSTQSWAAKDAGILEDSRTCRRRAPGTTVTSHSDKSPEGERERERAQDIDQGEFIICVAV